MVFYFAVKCWRSLKVIYNWLTQSRLQLLRRCSQIISFLSSCIRSTKRGKCLIWNIQVSSLKRVMGNRIAFRKGQCEKQLRAAKFNLSPMQMDILALSFFILFNTSIEIIFAICIYWGKQVNIVFLYCPYYKTDNKKKWDGRGIYWNL